MLQYVYCFVSDLPDIGQETVEETYKLSTATDVVSESPDHEPSTGTDTEPELPEYEASSTSDNELESPQYEASCTSDTEEETPNKKLRVKYDMAAQQKFERVPCKPQLSRKGVSNNVQQRKKCTRRRWSDDEFCKLSKVFAKALATKKLPSGSEISQFIKRHSTKRSVAQIRSQLHNIISGKVVY